MPLRFDDAVRLQLSRPRTSLASVTAARVFVLAALLSPATRASPSSGTVGGAAFASQLPESDAKLRLLQEAQCDPRLAGDWSKTDRDFCCTHFGKGCPDLFEMAMSATAAYAAPTSVSDGGALGGGLSLPTTAAPSAAGSEEWSELIVSQETYDCSAGVEHSSAWWSEDKRTWCCHHKFVGCTTVLTTTTVITATTTTATSTSTATATSTSTTATSTTQSTTSTGTSSVSTTWTTSTQTVTSTSTLPKAIVSESTTPEPLDAYADDARTSSTMTETLTHTKTSTSSTSPPTTTETATRTRTQTQTSTRTATHTDSQTATHTVTRTATHTESTLTETKTQSTTPSTRTVTKTASSTETRMKTATATRTTTTETATKTTRTHTSTKTTTSKTTTTETETETKTTTSKTTTTKTKTKTATTTTGTTQTTTTRTVTTTTVHHPPADMPEKVSDCQVLFVWSEDRLAWCCEHAKIGCEEKDRPPIQRLFAHNRRVFVATVIRGGPRVGGALVLLTAAVALAMVGAVAAYIRRSASSSRIGASLTWQRIGQVEGAQGEDVERMLLP